MKIGARVSEVALLGDGAIRWASQFPSGGDLITQAIADRLRAKLADAERIKCQWALTLLPPPSAEVVGAAIQGAIAEWLTAFTELLRREERFMLPERVYLLGGGARLEPLLELLRTRHWYGELTFLDRLEVKRLEAEAIAAKMFRNRTPALTGPEEVALAALAWRLVSREAA